MPCHAPNNSNPVTREQGLGITDDQVVCFTQQILQIGRTCKVKIQGKTSQILGADICIITSHQWPDDWPLTDPQGKISGLGEPQQLAQSAAVHPCLGLGKQLAHFQPFIADIPCNLWGRDLLTQWHLVLSNKGKTNHMTVRMGYQAGKGLGKNLQGDPSPLPIQPKLDRKGVGYKNF